jgi:serine/threonine protein kinase
VFKARHRYLGKTAALKLAHPIDFDAALEEAKKVASLPEHRNVIKVLDAGAWSDGRVFIAFEYSELGSLDTTEPLDPGRACALVSGACRGLSHIHQHGLLHLDLRPANILLGDGDTPILTDFGLAKSIHDANVDDWYYPHVAPEIIETGSGEVASDVWAMGMTLAHLLTGGAICRPFLTGVDLLEASLNGDWPRLDDIGIHVPVRLRKVIERATKYQSADRQANIEEFKHEIDRATPKVSLWQDGNVLRSSDGEWTVARTQAKDGSYSVATKRRGRQQSELSVSGVTSRAADRKIAEVVTRLAGYS